MYNIDYIIEITELKCSTKSESTPKQVENTGSFIKTSYWYCVISVTLA